MINALSNKPEGWTIVKIPEVLFFQEGPGVRKWQFTDSGVKLLNVGNINKGKVNLDSTKIFISEDEAFNKYSHFLVDAGDLLIACSGIVLDNFHNKISFAEQKHLPLCMNTSTMRFKALDENIIDLYFFKYFLQTVHFNKQLRRLITGSAQLNFGPSHIKKIDLFLPPLAEQQQIAAILDAADNLRQKDQQLIEHYTVLSQSLFLELFGDPMLNPMGWEKRRLGDLTEMITDGKHGDCINEENSGYFFISAKDIKDGIINYSKARQITQKDFNEVHRRTNLTANDVVMVNTGATIGKIAIAPDTAITKRTTFQKSVAVIKPKKEILSSIFLKHVFLYRIKDFATKGTGSAVKNLLLSEMRRFEIITPQLELQNQFAERISIIEQQKLQAQASLEKSDALFNSLLQRAFNGELTAKKSQAA